MSYLFGRPAYVEYSNGSPSQVRQFNTPTNPKNIAYVTGFFAQDSWSLNRLTLNIGGRWDKYVGKLPAQSNAAGLFVGAISIDDQTAISHSKSVWRAGASYDLMGNGRTALKASYSRYALQVGINRVTDVNPLSNGSRTCPWTDPNGNGRFEANEIDVSQCSSFSGGVGFAYAPDVAWPYSDEVTAGVEMEVRGGVRFGAMYYYRTNRDQIGQRNTLQPTSAYTPFTLTIPNGPGGTVANPQPMTITAYNIPAAINALNNTVRDNESFLDSD